MAHRVGVIGAGNLGRLHAMQSQTIPGISIAAVFDIRKEAADALVKDLGGEAKAVGSADEIFDDPCIDVVMVVVPTPLHKEYVLRAAAAGKDVFCEKPMARTSAEAKEMAEACELGGVRLMIGHVLRIYPEYVRAKEQIDSGAVGTPAVIRTTRASGCPYGWDKWYTKFEMSGGVILDMVVHDLDWLCWVLGKPVRVFARGLAEKGLAMDPPKDYALITLAWESGTLAHVEGSWAYPGPFTTKLEVAGSEGLLAVDNLGTAPIRLELPPTPTSPGGVKVPESPMHIAPHHQEDIHFFKCLDTGEPFMVSPADAVLAVRVAEAALESIATGKAVEV